MGKGAMPKGSKKKAKDKEQSSKDSLASLLANVGTGARKGLPGQGANPTLNQAQLAILQQQPALLQLFQQKQQQGGGAALAQKEGAAGKGGKGGKKGGADSAPIELQVGSMVDLGVKI